MAPPLHELPMRVLLVHNHYAQRGGEDMVFAQESAMLRERGHEVLEFTKDNREISGASALRMGVDAIWSRASAAEVDSLIRQFRPEVLHAHNTLPQISPAIFHAAARAGVPAVMTLHNYRLVCASGLLLRDGAVCEACVGRRFGWPGVTHGCYRGSKAATASVVSMTALHSALGTWRHKVTRFIALCQFAREKVLAAGIPAEKVVIKPNFVIDRHAHTAPTGLRAGGLFVGRLSVEKGVGTLLEAWKSIDADLDIYGTGDLSAQLQAGAPGGVRFCGFAAPATVGAAMRKAQFLVVPSTYYEGFPVVLAEAFSAGLPVITSRLGALQELVLDGVTGLHFTPGDAQDLRRKVLWALAHPEQVSEMGRTARRLYEERYTPERNYQRLMEIYGEARASL